MSVPTDISTTTEASSLDCHFCGVDSPPVLISGQKNRTTKNKPPLITVLSSCFLQYLAEMVWNPFSRQYVTEIFSKGNPIDFEMDTSVFLHQLQALKSTECKYIN